MVSFSGIKNALAKIPRLISLRNVPDAEGVIPLVDTVISEKTFSFLKNKLPKAILDAVDHQSIKKIVGDVHDGYRAFPVTYKSAGKLKLIPNDTIAARLQMRRSETDQVIKAIQKVDPQDAYGYQKLLGQLTSSRDTFLKPQTGLARKEKSPFEFLREYQAADKAGLNVLKKADDNADLELLRLNIPKAHDVTEKQAMSFTVKDVTSFRNTNLKNAGKSGENRIAAQRVYADTLNQVAELRASGYTYELDALDMFRARMAASGVNNTGLGLAANKLRYKDLGFMQKKFSVLEDYRIKFSHPDHAYDLNDQVVTTEKTFQALAQKRAANEAIDPDYANVTYRPRGLPYSLYDDTRRVIWNMSDAEYKNLLKKIPDTEEKFWAKREIWIAENVLNLKPELVKSRYYRTPEQLADEAYWDERRRKGWKIPI